MFYEVSLLEDDYQMLMNVIRNLNMTHGLLARRCLRSIKAPLFVPANHNNIPKEINKEV